MLEKGNAQPTRRGERFTVMRMIFSRLGTDIPLQGQTWVQSQC
jgi:hypothetical protein